MTTAEIKLKLITLYKEIYEMTNVKCRQCRVPLSCCSPEYCEIAIEYTKEVWNQDISGLKQEGQKIPFLNPTTGCVIPPHLRPNCTLHHCDINSLGFFKDDKNSITEKYFNLREEIEFLDYEISKTSDDVEL